MSEYKVTQKNKVVQLGDPKTVFEPFPNPNNSRQGPKKSKTTPKLSQNQMSKLKGTKKMKVIQLHENLFFPQKAKRIHLKGNIEEDIENICCSST